MNRTVTLCIISFLLIVSFAVALACGIMIAALHNRSMGESPSHATPDGIGTGKVDIPLTRRQMQKTYDSITPSPMKTESKPLPCFPQNKSRL